jgi:hypothetical protein
VVTASNLYIADSRQGTTRHGLPRPMREVEFTSDTLDLGSGFALWVSEMIQDGKQQSSRGVSFFWSVS